MKRILSLLGVGGLALLAVTPTHATVLFDSGGFEGPTYTLGNLVGQNGWIVDPAASTAVPQIQGTVVSSGLRAVEMAGGVNTWTWPDLSYTPGVGETVRVSFDVLRSAFTANNNFGYFVDVYDTTFTRIARTGLGRTGTATAPGSVQALATIGGASPGNYLIGNPLLNDTWYRFIMDLDFASDTYAVSINGALINSGLPFVVAATGIGDADLQLSGVAGATDRGYFDNYMVEAVPEPQAWAMSGLVLVGVAGLVIRRRRAA